VGARTVKSGLSRWFVGYKKHTLRLWLAQRQEAVLLVPLMSWIAPANRGDVLFLEASASYARRHLDFVPSFVVADMAYINFEVQRRLREQMQVGVITGLPPNYDLPKKVEPALTLRCPQGQSLQWLGLRPREQLHWFGVAPEPFPLCSSCWEQCRCPRQFCFAPTDHEIVLGTVPLSTSVAQKLLRQSRSWIEAAQSYEKNQLGLASMFLNSLRLTSVLGLLADTVSLLRAHALLHQPSEPALLHQMLPNQLSLDLE
jgi:hypothetical protein